MWLLQNRAGGHFVFYGQTGSGVTKPKNIFHYPHPYRVYAVGIFSIMLYSFRDIREQHTDRKTYRQTEPKYFIRYLTILV